MRHFPFVAHFRQAVLIDTTVTTTTTIAITLRHTLPVRANAALCSAVPFHCIPLS